MPPETASPGVEDDQLSKCLHCRNRPATQRMAGASLCAECVAKGVRPRYDIERDPEYVARQAQARRQEVEAERTWQAASRRSQDHKRATEAAKIAKSKAAPEPVKSGSQLRGEARERARPAEVG